MPELENVMNNYMKCSEMMFGFQVKYGITYKEIFEYWWSHRIVQRKVFKQYFINVQKLINWVWGYITSKMKRKFC